MNENSFAAIIDIQPCSHQYKRRPDKTEALGSDVRKQQYRHRLSLSPASRFAQAGAELR